MFGAIAALVILIVLPLGSLLLGSVFGDTGFTFDNFARALANRLYYQALINSLILGFWTGLFSVLIGVPLAWAVSRTNLPGKGFVRLTASIAYLSPPFLVAIAYVNLFGPNAGIVNVFIHDVLGLPSLTFNIFSMTGLVFVTVPHTFPFVYLLAVSALQSVDASLEELAQILGAGRMRTALTVTLPLVAPAILSGALIGFVNAIALFGSQAIIGLPARIFTLPTRIYALFDYPPQYGLASALSLLFVAITVAALYLQRAYLARRSYVTLGGKGVRLQPVDLGWVRWLLLLFCLLVFVITILLPYAALVAVSFSKSWGLAFWQNLTLDNYRFVLLDYDVTRRAIVNSLVLATLAAHLAVAMGAIIGWIDLRTRLPPAGHRLCLALVPLGLPGIVMAVAILEFWLRLPVKLYGTLAILLLAYWARYIPLGVRAANASLRQIEPALEESARHSRRILGRTMREITLPLMRPASLPAGSWSSFRRSRNYPPPSCSSARIRSPWRSPSTTSMKPAISKPVAALAIVNMTIIGGAIALANRIAGMRPLREPVGA